MNRGRGRTPYSRGRNSSMRWSPRPTDQSKNPHNQVAGHGLSGSNACSVEDGRKSVQKIPGGSFPQSPGPQPLSHYNNQPSPSCVREDGSYNVTSSQPDIKVPDASVSVTKVIPSSSAQSGSTDSGTKVASGETSNFETLHSDVAEKLKVSELQSKTELQDGHLECRNPTSDHKTEHTKESACVDLFDICPRKESGTVILKPSLLAKNRERRNETKRNIDTATRTVLRPGMILLKAYISISDQVKIVKKCRELGLGSAGFYQPEYREGTKLHLRMMCLGKNWDPQTKEYADHRPFDGAKPPNIPVEFHQFIEKAMRDSYVLIEQDPKTRNPEKILPWMSPDICLVNFYSQNGRLGLHQDKDESEESLRRGLPVVSFSIGDSAEFLYGDERDVDRAQKVVLESGDVLIFGGESRNIFHGVSVIQPNSAPKLLLEGTNLRPGRLNLTFREY